jgi:hypothetical protein
MITNALGACVAAAVFAPAQSKATSHAAHAAAATDASEHRGYT